MKKKSSTLKGFTLTELMIVVAIFAVLVAIITPSWMSYLNRSKFRAYNQKAKTIFNAAQIAVTEMEFTERQYVSRLSAGIDDTEMAAVYRHVATPDADSTNPGGARDDWFIYFDGRNASICLSDGTPVLGADGAISSSIPNDLYADTQAEAILDWQNKISGAVSRITKGDCIYKIWIQGYTVMSVACSERQTSRFIGAHPTTIFELDGLDINTDDLTHTTVEDVDLRWFDLNTTDDEARIPE